MIEIGDLVRVTHSYEKDFIKDFIGDVMQVYHTESGVVFTALVRRLDNHAMGWYPVEDIEAL